MFPFLMKVAERESQAPGKLLGRLLAINTAGAIAGALFAACPLDRDPLWAGHPESSRHLVRAGVAFHRAMVGKVLGQREAVQVDWDIFKREWSNAAQ